MKYGKIAPLVVDANDVIYGVWVIGNCYKSEHGFYGEFPHSFLERVLSMFPDVPEPETLSLFSGTQTYGTTFDINPDLHPNIVGDAGRLSEYVPANKFTLIIADPPYSESDAQHYGHILVPRNKVVMECLKILQVGGFLIWFDQVLPMYPKLLFPIKMRIGLNQSTNHRVRFVFGYVKQALEQAEPPELKQSEPISSEELIF
jgi:hypothetical protein